jgi:hypothetical protein
MTSQRVVIPPPAALVALAGWIVPGSGYWLLGQRGRATIVFVAVVFIFAMGLLIGGLRVVDAPTSLTFTDIVQNKPWFIAQVLCGPLSIASAIGANQLDVLRVSHSHSWEIGTLYTAVAGMLNLLVLIDATHRAGISESERTA